MDAILQLITWISSPLRQSPLFRTDGITDRRRSSRLERLPVEVLLHIIFFLPASSIACLSLTSRWHHEALKNRADPKMRHDHLEKARFIRLIEDDLPDMMACCICNILYHWQKWRRYMCPNWTKHAPLRRGALWCFPHGPCLIYRNMVEVFL